jgi:hypothetical protein
VERLSKLAVDLLQCRYYGLQPNALSRF